MSSLLLVVTAAALGIEVGWQPLPEGGHEYTIQIEPQLLGVLERGTEEIFSEVPPELNVRRYRITVGRGPLPRDAGQVEAAPAVQPDRPPPAQPDRAPPTEADDPFGLPPADASPPADAGDAAPEFGPDGAQPPAEDAEPADAEGPGLGASAHTTREAAPPAKLPPAADARGPIEQATFAQQPKQAHDAAEIETQKPELPDGAARPWTVLVAAVALLGCSLGGNVYLAWIAWGARHRYRDAVAKLRTAS